MSRIVVTGASGYIGGQTVLQLLDQGHSVLAIDDRREPEHLTGKGARYLISDFADSGSFNLIKAFGTEAIIHCAGTSLVGPSLSNPREYYQNNFVKTKRMLDFLVDHAMANVRVIFSSSAAVYGEPVMCPCEEVDPVSPISPYGESKLMIEYALASYARAYGLDYVAFRYFNACGADSKGRHGQEPGATHLVARVLESIRDHKEFILNGNDYPTEDGTCVRDYIHVEDLAAAHIRAIDRSVPAGVYNLGTSTGSSNQEIIHLAEKITGQLLDVKIGTQRPGDPAILTATADKFKQTSGWAPEYQIEDMVQHAWNWYVRQHP